MRGLFAILAAALFTGALAQAPAPRDLVDLLQKLPGPVGPRSTSEGTTKTGLPLLYTRGVQKLRDDPVLAAQAGRVVDLYRADAEAGDAVARVSLARLLKEGTGTPRSEVQAFHWMQLAAEQGSASAQSSLAYYYYSGEGVPKNRDEAVRWAREATKTSDAEARAWTLLGALSLTATPPDTAAAIRAYSKAAEEGEPYALMNLADMQRSGYGMPKDPATAVQRMKKALEIFRSAASGSTATEDVRRLLVQAQAAIREKQFQEAEGLLREARRHEPWSPMCWYNLALVQGELQRFGDAMWDMQVFLMLAPDAPQARGGQDLIYEWERKVRK